MKDFLENKKVLIIVGVSVLILSVLGFLYFYDAKEETEPEEELVVNTETETTTQKNITKFYVDVKGAVKKAGVYEVKEGDRVIDAITLAGGLAKNANTGNINLSKRLESEMVVYVYTNNEVKQGSVKSSCDTECNCEGLEINNCIESSNESTNKGNLININKATKEELMTLSGVGESKAEAIISYREENGSFKSIEDIKNVTGIGDAMFEKIKGSITV